MVETNPQKSIVENELEFAYLRSDGPGGQNVNKVATAVQLRFDVLHSNSLSEEVKSRLIRLAGKRMNQEGVLLIEARRYRTQERNREDALERFYTLVQQALESPKMRTETKPTKSSQEERLKEKKRRGAIKRLRTKRSIEQE